ncbi:MAG: hypothetical protein ACREXU_12100 [Gammaproteobacteria bacterium]
MGLFGAFVFGQLVYKLVYPQLPTFETMGAVGVLALADGACFALLWRHRAEDISMRSVWLCGPFRGRALRDVRNPRQGATPRPVV